MTVDLALKLTRRIPATPERVFEAWLNPELMAKFISPFDTAQFPPRVSTDPRVGGRYDIVMWNDMGEVPHWGVYKVIEKPTRLVFTWNSPHATPDSVVELTFRRMDDGGTELTLVHDRFPSEGSRDGHEKGWTAILDEFQRFMAG